ANKVLLPATLSLGLLLQPIQQVEGVAQSVYQLEGDRYALASWQVVQNTIDVFGLITAFPGFGGFAAFMGTAHSLFNGFVLGPAISRSADKLATTQQTLTNTLALSLSEMLSASMFQAQREQSVGQSLRDVFKFLDSFTLPDPPL